MHYRPVEGWGRLPEGWSFVEATSVAVDASDNVWVFNRGQHPVIVFDREGKFLRSWGEGLIRRAHGINIGPDGSVWLTDDLHHTIRQFTPEGKLLLTIGDPDQASTLHGGKPFNRPTHSAICPKTGNVYISDGYGNSRVHKFDPTGRPLHVVGRAGHRSRLLQHPAQHRHRRRRARLRGRPRELPRADLRRRRQVPRPVEEPPPAVRALRRLRATTSSTSASCRAHLPVNKEVPNIGARVSILSIKGELMGRVGGRFAGEKPGEFVAPHGVAVDSRGDFYVAEVSFTAVGQHGDAAARAALAAEVRTRMSRLDEAGIAQALRQTPGWERAGSEIRRTYRFKDFREALAFVNRVGDLAERAGHHPDIDIRYNAVTLALTTPRRRRSHREGLRAGPRDRPRLIRDEDESPPARGIRLTVFLVVS